MEWFPILIIILNYFLIVILLIDLKNLKSKKNYYWKWNSLLLYCDLWYLPKDILKDTSYKYILDRVETIFPNCFKDILLNQKKEKKFKKIEIFNENFGMPKILQTDNGKRIW